MLLRFLMICQSLCIRAMAPGFAWMGRTEKRAMQNQNLQPEKAAVSGLNQSQRDAAAKTEPLPVTVVGEETHPEPQNIGVQQPQTEEVTILPPQNNATGTDESLLDKLIRQARKQKRWRRISLGFYYTGFFVFVTYSLLNRSHRFPYLPRDFSLPLMLAYTTALMAGVLAQYRWTRSTANITAIDDTRAVGALAEAMDIPDKGILAKAQAALTRLLPRLEPGDAHLLNEAQRRCLYGRLKIEYAHTTPDFLVALLEALEKVGDAAALSAVQNLTTATVTTANGRCVQAAAKKCLPVLRQRVQTLETSSTLLRASSAGEESGTSLLRPAQGGNDDPPEHLLRPGKSDSEGKL